MLFNSPTQYAVLALMLIVGWLFGFASHPGGKKWRAAYEDERARHATLRDESAVRYREADERIALLERDRATLERRHAELDADRTGAAPVARTAAAPAFGGAAAGATAPAKRGWFDWGRGDDLTRLRGLDATMSQRLKAERVEHFADLANLSDQDEIALERRLDIPAGYIQREQWRDQARLLAERQNAEHAARFGSGG